MRAGISLCADSVQELKSKLGNFIAEQSKQIQDLLGTFKRNDAKYSNAFLKHFPDSDASLRSKYELVCDLRKSAMEEHTLDIMHSMQAQTAAIQQYLANIKETVIKSADSQDYESVSSPIKSETNHGREEDEIGNVNQNQSAEGSRYKNVKAVDPRSGAHDEKDANDNEYHFRTKKRKRPEEQSTAFAANKPLPKRRRVNHRNNKSTELPNISGYWKYRSDPRYHIVLKDNPTTGQFCGFMMFDNKKKYEIEGNREGNMHYVDGQASEKILYKFTKTRPDAQSVTYSYTVEFDQNAKTMSITRDGKSNTKTAILESRDVPPEFRGELNQLKWTKITRVTRPSSFHGKRLANTMSGLWRGTNGCCLENIQYILFEDFTNGNIIGFMQEDGVTKSTITGGKSPDGSSHLIERMHYSQQQVYHQVILFPNKQIIEMRRSGDPTNTKPYILHLVVKRPPGPLYQELERLKQIENYDGRRFLYL